MTTRPYLLIYLYEHEYLRTRYVNPPGSILHLLGYSGVPGGAYHHQITELGVPPDCAHGRLFGSWAGTTRIAACPHHPQIPPFLLERCLGVAAYKTAASGQGETRNRIGRMEATKGKDRAGFASAQDASGTQPPSRPSSSAPSCCSASTSSVSTPVPQHHGQLHVPPSVPPTPHGVVSLFSNAHHFNISNLRVNAPTKTVFERESFSDRTSRMGRPMTRRSAAMRRNAIQRQERQCKTTLSVSSDMGEGGRSSKKIMWLGGPAGSGKTAVAGSVAETCREEGMLAASFFFSSFSGSADRYSKRYVVATLAHHLARHECLQEYQSHLLASLERYPDIFHKQLMEQAECLLLGPLQAIPDVQDKSSWPTGIVLDGLDEVRVVEDHDNIERSIPRKDEDDQVEILEVLLCLASSPAFPFRIFVTSRPEQIITEFFATASAQSSTVTLFLDSKYQPDADIKRFLKSRFAAVRRRFSISDPVWPGDDILNQIMDMSSGQFIIPATIVRYVESGLPQRQLDDVMRVKGGDSSRKNPFAMVDALYRHIFNRTPEPLLAVKWVHCIATFHARKAGGGKIPIPALFWKHFLEDVEGEFDYLLPPLASLLSIPPPNRRQDTPITLYHKSVVDFLSSEARCGELFIHADNRKSFPTERCVSVLRNKGPKVPLSVEYNLNQFLATFLTLCPLVIPSQFPDDTDPLYAFAPFLEHGIPAPIAGQLAACDIMRRVESLAPYLGSICCAIHKNLCACQPTDHRCHPACTQWREAIIAEARAMNWSVDKFEQWELDQLQSIGWHEFDMAFSKMEIGDSDGPVLLPDGLERWDKLVFNGVPTFSTRSPGYRPLRNPDNGVDPSSTIDQALREFVRFSMNALDNRVQTGEDMNWVKVIETFDRNPFLERDPEMSTDRMEQFEAMPSFKVIPFGRIGTSRKDDEIVHILRMWLEDRLVQNVDINSTMKVPFDDVAQLVTRTDPLHFRHIFSSSVRHSLDFSHVGVIRYPDIVRPYIQVYCINLNAWASSKSKWVVLKENQSGFNGELSVRTYKPRPEATQEVLDQVHDMARREALLMFGEESS
ncbi:hypothetical protein NMY22_g9489 [Coprinellus aureogranulatus]|nr:hypothetical protein NMY22_g9489 [Coprinellus aureogranulatus]